MKTSMKSCSDCDNLDKRTQGLTIKKKSPMKKVVTKITLKKVK
jgi:hypothetical protein